MLGFGFEYLRPRREETTALLYLGDDEDGSPLEVMAVELESGELFVIHAMPLRKKYSAEYEEGKKWRN
jgi:hypothetical protein